MVAPGTGAAMISNIYKWMVAWFDPKAFQSGNGVSLSRRLMALLVLVVAFTLAVDGYRRGITTAWSVAATGLGTTLAGIWGVSKLKPNKPTGGNSASPGDP